MILLNYDGSFEGLLTAVFECYEYKLKEVRISSGNSAANTLFSEPREVVTDTDKSSRLWKGIKNLGRKQACNYIYKSYLSELDGIEDQILAYIRLLFASHGREAQNFSNPVALQMSKITKMVNREKHRMDAFVRFQLTKDGIYVATVEPDFNVLPLNAAHFKARYADQAWLIYDLKRQYGIYYDLLKVELVCLEDSECLKRDISDTLLDPVELEFREMWKEYFRSTNIVARKNTSLHLRHVPLRYWRYLSEKQI